MAIFFGKENTIWKVTACTIDAEPLSDGWYDLQGDDLKQIQFVRYAGIKDKNGLKLFVTDIIKIPKTKNFPYQRNCEIKEVFGSIYLSPIGNTVGCFLNEIVNKRFEKIGNALETPDLVGGSIVPNGSSIAEGGA